VFHLGIGGDPGGPEAVADELGRGREAVVSLPFLIGADDEVAFAHLRARDAQCVGGIELAQH
jgi:hypothetical protein